MSFEKQQLKFLDNVFILIDNSDDESKIIFDGKKYGLRLLLHQKQQFIKLQLIDFVHGLKDIEDTENGAHPEHNDFREKFIRYTNFFQCDWKLYRPNGDHNSLCSLQLLLRYFFEYCNVLG